MTAECMVQGCDAVVPEAHNPCCSSSMHGKPLCCEHYCNSHFLEVNRCSPDQHEAVIS
jgi:hypothetical protein